MARRDLRWSPCRIRPCKIATLFMDNCYLYIDHAPAGFCIRCVAWKLLHVWCFQGIVPENMYIYFSHQMRSILRVAYMSDHDFVWLNGLNYICIISDLLGWVLVCLQRISHASLTHQAMMTSSPARTRLASAFAHPPQSKKTPLASKRHRKHMNA